MGSAPSKKNSGRVVESEFSTSSVETDAEDDFDNLSVAVTLMTSLNETKEFSNTGTFQCLQKLNDIHTSLKDKRLSDLLEICKILINNGLLELYIRLWDYCHVDTKELYSSAGGIKYQNLLQMKNLFLSYTNTCTELSTACYENDQVIERLMREFTIPELEVQFHGIEHVKKMVVINFGLLHNLLRMNSHNKYHIRKYGGIQRVLSYEKSTYSLVEAYVFIILAFCINEDENKKIMAERSVIAFIQNILMVSLESEDHINRQFDMTFSAEEMVEAIRKLASNDDNKKTLVDEGVLPLLTKLLDPGTSSELEHLRALNCIWSLAFRVENKDKIKDEPGLLDGVRRLRDEFKSNELINKACSGIMFVLDLEQPTEEASEIPKSVKKHLMISYNWEVRDTMKQLRDILQQNGYATWMDVDKMHGSTLSAMGHAVDNAALIIVALTEYYKESNSCRTEGEYAYKRGVPMLPLILENDYDADGWLAAWVGTKLHIDLSPRALHANREAQFAKVIKEVSAMRIPMAEGNPVAAKQYLSQRTNYIETASSVDKTGSSLVKAKLPCEGWTVEEVRDWCHTNSVKDKILNKCDGIVLAQLCKLRVESPDTYYLVLRQDMHLSWKVMLQFTHAVETLL